jgi:hypothetical protein
MAKYYLEYHRNKISCAKINTYTSHVAYPGKYMKYFG